MVGVGARGDTALQLQKSIGLTSFVKENENSDSIIGSLIQSMKVKIKNPKDNNINKKYNMLFEIENHSM